MTILSGHTRRKFLKLVSALTASLPVVNLKATENKGFVYYIVKNQHSETGVQAETIVLANHKVKEFSGDGYYLYPAWGSPAIYEVRQDESNDKRSLVFYYPGSIRPLWKMALTKNEIHFSGRVEGLLDNASQLAGLKAGGIKFSPLTMPALPV